MIEIKPTGSYFDIDKDGYLVNPASIEKIQNEWKEVLDMIIQKQKELFKDDLVAIYVRGSVSKGEAIKNISDIDTFSYVKTEQDNIDKKKIREAEIEIESIFPFVQKS